METAVQQGDITKESRRNANQALKEAYEGAKNVKRDISFLMILNRDLPICVILCRLIESGGIYRRRRDETKKMRRTQENFLKQCKKGALALNLRLEPEKQFNGLDQKLYER